MKYTLKEDTKEFLVITAVCDHAHQIKAVHACSKETVRKHVVEMGWIDEKEINMVEGCSLNNKSEKIEAEYVVHKNLNLKSNVTTFKDISALDENKKSVAANPTKTTVRKKTVRKKTTNETKK